MEGILRGRFDGIVSIRPTHISNQRRRCSPACSAELCNCKRTGRWTESRQLLGSRSSGNISIEREWKDFPVRTGKKRKVTSPNTASKYRWSKRRWRVSVLKLGMEYDFVRKTEVRKYDFLRKEVWGGIVPKNWGEKFGRWKLSAVLIQIPGETTLSEGIGRGDATSSMLLFY